MGFDLTPSASFNYLLHAAAFIRNKYSHILVHDIYFVPKKGILGYVMQTAHPASGYICTTDQYQQLPQSRGCLSGHQNFNLSIQRCIFLYTFIYKRKTEPTVSSQIKRMRIKVEGEAKECVGFCF